MRTISSDSFCPIQHKMAAYHSMVHRLCRLPLSITNFKKEYEHIKTTSRINDYSENMVDKLIYKHTRKVNNFNMTTFFTQREKTDKKRVAPSFVPQITNKFKKIFSEHQLDIVYKNDRKIVNLLGSTKDKIPLLSKSGIYEIQCGDCKQKYYGQTKRSIETRFKEHMTYIRLNQPQKSAIASHVLNNGHENIKIDNLKLLKEVNDHRRLDAYESFFIQKDPNALNLDNGNVESCLLNIVCQSRM